MTNIKILEWNINQRSCENSSFPEYVITEISQKNPDVIVLVEFKVDTNGNIDFLMQSQILFFFF